MFSSMKPLYIAQRQFQYRRHKKRLETISSDRPKVNVNKKFDEFFKLRQRSCQIKLQKRIQKVNEQNEKLLVKLLEISSKKSASFQNHISNDLKSNPIQFNNPFRKKTIREINQQNSLLGSRLIEKKSQFSSINNERSISEYVKMKKALQKNRKIKLDPTFEYSQHNRSRITKNGIVMTQCDCFEHYKGQSDQCNNSEKSKTQPATACLKHVVID